MRSERFKEQCIANDSTDLFIPGNGEIFITSIEESKTIERHLPFKLGQQRNNGKVDVFEDEFVSECDRRLRVLSEQFLLSNQEGERCQDDLINCLDQPGLSSSDTFQACLVNKPIIAKFLASKVY